MQQVVMDMFNYPTLFRKKFSLCVYAFILLNLFIKINLNLNKISD